MNKLPVVEWIHFSRGISSVHRTEGSLTMDLPTG